MPRNARKQSKADIYHVMMRGVNRQDLFHDEDDYVKFLQDIRESYNENLFNLHAYCLMTTHAHLLIGKSDIPKAQDISPAIKSIGIRYAYYYNKKYKRDGHLFGDRFKSEPVEDDAYFISVFRYIHRNPVKAGIVKTPAQYNWSSYHSYVGIPHNNLIYRVTAHELIGASDDIERLINEERDDPCLDMDEPKAQFTDIELSAYIEQAFGITAPRISRLKPSARVEAILRLLDLGISQRQLSRVTGMSLGSIHGIKAAQDKPTNQEP